MGEPEHAEQGQFQQVQWNGAQVHEEGHDKRDNQGQGEPCVRSDAPVSLSVHGQTIAPSEAGCECELIDGPSDGMCRALRREVVQ